MSGSTWNWIGGTIDLESPTDWALTAGPVDGTIPQTGDTVTNSGTMVGVGAIAASVINNGTIEPSNNSVGGSSTGGEMTIQGSVSGTGAITIELGATLQIDGVLGSAQSIAFSPGAPETLILGSPAAVTPNTITGFALGDRIEVSNGVTITGGAIVSGGTTSIPFVNSSGTAGTYQFTNLSYAPGTTQSFEYGLDFATGAQNIALTRFFTWTGATNTTFGVATNWSDAFGVAPGPSDFATFSSSGGTISGTGSVYVLDFRDVGAWTLAPGTSLSDTESVQLGQNGIGSTSLSVGNTATISSAGFITVAGVAGNEDLLSITAGGVVRQTGAGVTYAHGMSIGTAGASGTLAPADGVVLVSGAGSLLDLGANGLTVAGNGGSGVLTVQRGGTVDAASADSSLSSSVSIANSAGNGSILVTGAGSALNATGYFLDGRGGTGSLTIQSGGLVVVTDAPLNGSGIGIGTGRGAGPSSAADVGGDGVATVTSGGTLELNSITSGMNVGGDGTSGILNVNSGGTVLTGAGITVGTATTANGTIYGGTGALNIGAGGLVKVGIAAQSVNYSVTVGGGNSLLNGVPTSQASGQAVISGAGAELNTNGNPLAIGYLSDGSMIVSQGGSVVSGSANDLTISALSIGRLSNGSLTVTDPGTQFTANGGVYIGRGGTGALNVENHATMDVRLDGNGDGYLDIGNSGLTNGETLITGGSGSALVTSGGDLFSQKPVTIGEAGDSGSLDISDGGLVEAAQTLRIGNTVTVPAGGIEITASGTQTLGSATQFAGAGVVNVGAGGILRADGGGITSAGTSDIVVGEGIGSSAALNVTGAGATVNTGGYRLAVGSAGQGSLLVGQGGTVLAGTPFASDDAITAGGSAGATGVVTVSDPGSELLAVGQFAVGLGGQGSLLIENQGTAITGANAADATEGVDIAQNAGASGTATVTGTKSLLTNTGRFIVGDAGVGSLAINSGGTVTTSANATIANTGSASSSSVNVSGAGSNWRVAGSLIVGDAGFGQLSLAQGATVTGAALTAGGAAAGSGVVSVAGTGSALNLTGVLNVGGLAPGELSILNAGEVTAASVTIGAGAGGAGNLVIGAGSTLTVTGTTTPLVVGTGTVAALLNIQGGTLVLSGSPTFGANGRLVQVGGLIDPAPTLIVAGNAFGGGAVDEASVEVLDTATSVSKAPDITGLATFLAPLVTGGSAAKPGIWNIDTNGTLVLNTNTVAATQEFTFADNTGVLEIGQQVTLDGGGTPQTIQAAAIGGFQGLIDSYVTGDQIIVDTTAAAGFLYTGGATITVNALVGGVPAGAQEGALVFTDPVAAAQAFADSTSATPSLGDQVIPPPCYAAGTLIETLDGPVAVEQLRMGDVVRTVLGGPGRIVWVGSRAVACERHPRPETVWPVRIARDAFGPGLPARDLFVSPDHALYLDGVLIPAKLLVNGTTVRQARRRHVVYHHIELARHDVVLAEGLPAETYLDTGDRAKFAGGRITMLYPDFTSRAWEMLGCAPLVLTGEGLAKARRAVMEHQPAGRRAFGS
jgi:collagen type I/II/III/V/XI/XXIV/XXVII alpha